MDNGFISLNAAKASASPDRNQSGAKLEIRATKIQTGLKPRQNQDFFICRDFVPGDEVLLAELIKEVFSQFVAPDFPSDEAAVFLESQEAKIIYFRFLFGKMFIIVAQDKEAAKRRLKQGIAGFIEVQNNNHISLLFVRKEHQGQGVARRLISDAVKKCRAVNPSLDGITLNATPSARLVYEKLGFEKTDWPVGNPAGNSIPMVLRLG